MTVVNLVLSAHAEGFRNPPPGTFDLARAGGRIAQVDDSSAVQHNPANVVELSAPEFLFTPSIVYIGVDYESPSGEKGNTHHPWKALPNIFGSIPMFDGNAAFGVGVTVPYGISNEWDPNSPAFNSQTSQLRYQAPYYANLQTINLNPTFSVKLGSVVQVGAGFDVMWSQVTFKQFYPWFIFPGSSGAEPDGHLEAKGSGFAFGGNLGLTLKLTERQRLAVTYRSPLTAHCSGDLTIDNITPAAAAFGATSHSDFGTKIAYPTIVAAGYGIALSDNVRLEADVEWLQFSRFKSLSLGVENNAFLLPSTTIPQNWHNTFTAGISADWKFANGWILRGGYQFYESPVPDSTFAPTIPDANQNVLTVGVAYQHKHYSLEASYGADFYATRHISNDQNPALNGTYDNTVHLFSLAYRYSF
jgi:long-chain fatty acid transport protein